MLNNQSLMTKKYFTELKDRELKDREKKNKRAIIMSEDHMDDSEEQEMKKTRPIKKNLFDELIKQNVMRHKPKIIRDNLKDKIIRDIWTLFGTVDEKKKGRSQRKMKNIMKY